MQAERFITRTDGAGRLIGLPILPANEEVEVIVLRHGKPPTPQQQALEQAYREAAAETDPAWEATVADGLNDEAW